jgi:hypothetical protein
VIYEQRPCIGAREVLQTAELCLRTRLNRRDHHRAGDSKYSRYHFRIGWIPIGGDAVSTGGHDRRGEDAKKWAAELLRVPFVNGWERTALKRGKRRADFLHFVERAGRVRIPGRTVPAKYGEDEPRTAERGRGWEPTSPGITGFKVGAKWLENRGE